MEKPVFRRDYPNEYYWTMDGDTPFAKKFNEVSKDFWAAGGRCLAPEEIVMQIHFEDYNERHHV